MLLLLGLLTTSGCYFFYPELPKAPRPQPVEGEDVKLLMGGEYRARCEPSSRGCMYTEKGEWRQIETYSTMRAKYDGKELTLFQLRRLVDPEFEQKLDRIRGRKGVCNLSLVPSAIGAIGGIVLTVAGAAADNLGDKALPIALAGLGGMVGGTLLSYPLGGFACRKAGREYKALVKGIGKDRTEFYIEGDDLVETVEMTKAFNRRFGKRVPPAGDDQPDETESSE
jgi:hypothetical protein